MNLEITPGIEPTYCLDLFDNLTAVCFFMEKGTELDFNLTMELSFSYKNPFGFLLAPHAWKLPFTYLPEEKRVLEPYLHTGLGALLRPRFWEAPKYPRPTTDVLVELNESIHHSIAYERRDEGRARSPEETIQLGSGACRDTAVLLAALLRQNGVAARLVSGYLCEFDTDEANRRAEGAMHAWAEAYIPGAGWLSMDPTNGIFANENFIPVAAGLEPEEISPVVGSYFADEPVPSEMTASLELTLLSSTLTEP
jgi:transglutaminase-like putative cysteine protease